MVAWVLVAKPLAVALPKVLTPEFLDLPTEQFEFGLQPDSFDLDASPIRQVLLMVPDSIVSGRPLLEC